MNRSTNNNLEEEKANSKPKEEPSESDEVDEVAIYFVDLAGAERAKRTGATGKKLKEAS